MSLTTYSGLQASVVRWLRRTDLTSDVPDFITLAEAQMNRRIRSRRKIIRADASLDAEYMSVPGDFSGVRTFKIVSANPPRALTYWSPEQMADFKSERTGLSGTPYHYTIVGAEFEFDYTPESALDCEIAYQQTIPALSDTNTSNWVLASHPDAYLYGALLQSAPFLKDDSRLGTWAQLFATVIDDINSQSLAESMGGALAPTASSTPV